MKPVKKKVYVGLSGGVDSSVSAALLKKAGFDVTGVFIKAWHPDFMPCDWKSDRRDAMRVCAKLDIPFVTLDLEKEYKKSVVDYMIREYSVGRTPNPDVMCNKEIKFGYFLKYAQRMGADNVATGHYAQNLNVNGTHILSEGKDKNKDQSYFLWTLTSKQLEKIQFPIGHLTKPEVRKLAKKFNLITAEKKDSQGLCFMGKVDMKEFLLHYLKEKRGSVLDIHGKKIGHHDGSIFLTIGQRHGFTVTNNAEKTKPLYITAKDFKKNTITVSEKTPEEIEKLGVKLIYLENTVWTCEKPIKNKIYSIRLRYRQSPQKATIAKNGNIWVVTLEKPHIGVSEGQSLVVYDKSSCLGGGIIKTAK